MNISKEECQSKNDSAKFAEKSINVDSVAEMPSPVKRNRKGQVRISKLFLFIEFIVFLIYT